MLPEITTTDKSIKQSPISEFNPHEIDICQYNDRKVKDKCKSLATVFVTTTFGKKKYCTRHFELILFRGK